MKDVLNFTGLNLFQDFQKARIQFKQSEGNDVAEWRSVIIYAINEIFNSGHWKIINYENFEVEVHQLWMRWIVQLLRPFYWCNFTMVH